MELLNHRGNISRRAKLKPAESTEIGRADSDNQSGTAPWRELFLGTNGTTVKGMKDAPKEWIKRCYCHSLTCCQSLNCWFFTFSSNVPRTYATQTNLYNKKFLFISIIILNFNIINCTNLKFEITIKTQTNQSNNQICVCN